MNELILWYAEAILSQAPCMRMSDISYRKNLFFLIIYQELSITQ